MWIRGRHRQGFTLTEMLVTMAILAVLAAAVIPLAQNTVKREKEIELRRALRTLRESIDEYKRMADENLFEFDEETEGYPPDLKTLVEGVESTDEEGNTRLIRFLRRIPRDPMTNSLNWGLRSYQDDTDSSTWGGENVYDVFTRSRGTAFDGTKYVDW